MSFRQIPETLITPRTVHWISTCEDQTYIKPKPFCFEVQDLLDTTKCCVTAPSGEKRIPRTPTIT